MNCTDFIFDKESLSNYGFMICSFDGNGSSWEGGDVNFLTAKAPDTDRFYYYSYSHDNPLVCNLSICKNRCGSDNIEDYVVTQEEHSNIMRWLHRTDGYHWLQFIQEDYEDVYYKCYINVVPHYDSGYKIGFDLTITTDGCYGYSQLFKRDFELTSTSPSYKFINYNDCQGYIYPVVTISPKTNGDIIFTTGCEGMKKTTQIKDNNSVQIVLNGDKDYFNGIQNPNSFNFVFPVLASTYDNNYEERVTEFYLEKNSVDLSFHIEYRYERMVTV